MLFWLFVSPVWADSEGPEVQERDEAGRSAEEVVYVWRDKFARWRDTRWLIASEVKIPTGFRFASTKNASFSTYAFQTQAVIHCDEEAVLGPKQLEVRCRIEDFAIRSTSYRRQRGARDRRVVQAVLDELDARVTGTEIELQVNERGAVTNVGMEGLERGTRREGLINETVRQVAIRMVSPFHMKLPTEGLREGHWPEFDSAMMSIPTNDAYTGSSQIVHWLNFYKGHLLVQDIGKGVGQVRALNFSALGTQSEASAFNAPGRNVPDFHYGLEMTGVSVFDIDTGIMKERVWSVVGTPTGSNENSGGYWYSGRIAMLDPNETVDLGASEQIGFPGHPVEGLPDWVPIDAEMQ